MKRYFSLWRDHATVLSDLSLKNVFPKLFMNLCCNSTLPDNHFLSDTLCCCRVKSRYPSRCVWKSMSGHVFAIRFSNDAEGSCVSIGDIRDRVSIQCGLVGYGTNLLNWYLRAWLGAAWKCRLKSLIVTECYIGTGAQASSRRLWGGGGILWCSLRYILIQPLDNGTDSRKLLLLHKKTKSYWALRKLIHLGSKSYVPFNIYIFFL